MQTRDLLNSGTKLAIKHKGENNDDTVCFERQLSREEIKTGETELKISNPWDQK